MKLEFINKKYKNSEKQNLNDIRNKNIKKEEEEYKEKIIDTIIQNTKLRLNKNKENSVGQSGANIARDEIKEIKKDEIKEFQKKLEKRDNEIKKKNDLIDDLNTKIKNLEIQNKNEKKGRDYEKENEEYKNQLKDYKNQLNEKNKEIEENKNKLEQAEKEKIEYYSKFQSSENNLKDSVYSLNELKNKFNQLQQENHKKENEIKNFQNQIEEYNSQLSQSKIDLLEKSNEQKKEIETKLKEYKAQIENKYIQMYKEKLKHSIEAINENIKNKIIEFENKYKKDYDDLRNKYEQKFSQLSNEVLQNKNNIVKCNTIHQGIQCNKCFKSPIVGFRYKCSKCNNYNLCEECEEKNSQNEEHPHPFIKMKKHEPDNFYYNQNNNPINFSQNIINNRKKINNEEDEFKIIQFGDKYEFECLNKENLNAKIEVGQDSLKLEIILNNTGTSQWPLNKVKLIADEKKNLKGEEIVLEPQKPCEQKKYIAIFNDLKQYPAGKYKAGFIFEIDGKKYGDNIDINIIIEQSEKKKIIEDFRGEFSLDEDSYSDDALWDLLKRHNMDKAEAFSELFG